MANATVEQGLDAAVIRSHLIRIEKRPKDGATRSTTNNVFWGAPKVHKGRGKGGKREKGKKRVLLPIYVT